MNNGIDTSRVGGGYTVGQHQLYKTDDKPQTGSGVTGAPGVTPTVEAAATLVALSTFAQIFASAALAPNRRGDLELTLAEVSAKLKETREDTQTEDVTTNQEKIRTSQREQAEKLDERTKKIEEALAAQEKAKTGNIFSRIFQAIGAILAIVVAAIAIATGVGAPMGALLIASAAVALYSLVDGIVQDTTGHGIAGNIAKARGASEEDIKKADEIAGYVVMGVSIALSIATIAVGVYNMANMTAKAVEKGTEFALKVGRAVEIADAINTVGSAASGVTTAVYGYQAGQAQADATQLKAESDIMSALNAALEGMIDQALRLLQNAQDATANMLDAAQAGLKDRGDTLGRVQFAG